MVASSYLYSYRQLPSFILFSSSSNIPPARGGGERGGLREYFRRNASKLILPTVLYRCLLRYNIIFFSSLLELLS
jgi:hypothetical protein